MKQLFSAEECPDLTWIFIRSCWWLVAMWERGKKEPGEEATAIVQAEARVTWVRVVGQRC